MRLVGIGGLVTGRLLGRRKRFFADIALDEPAHGESSIVAHCPNTGRMLGCLEPGAQVVVHDRASPRRTLRWTWVLVRAGGSWVAVESAWAVHGVREAWAAGLLPELVGPTCCHAEVPYGAGGRIDLLLCDVPERARVAGARAIWVEVKATTLVHGRVAAFPDAVTARGTRQLADLVARVEAGDRAAVVFAVMRSDVDAFTVADEIDPRYTAALRDANQRGVEVYAIAPSIRVIRRAGRIVAVDMRFVRRLPTRL
jgi:sugar fermentation stimulation protein A